MRWNPTTLSSSACAFFIASGESERATKVACRIENVYRDRKLMMKTRAPVACVLCRIRLSDTIFMRHMNSAIGGNRRKGRKLTFEGHKAYIFGEFFPLLLSEPSGIMTGGNAARNRADLTLLLVRE